jgi:hypothetical protein
MTVNDLSACLKNTIRIPTEHLENNARELQDLKKAAVDRGDEDTAKLAWCLEGVIKVHLLYRDAYAKMRLKEFYQAWCNLEQVELALFFLSPHFSDRFEDYDLSFVRKQTALFQSIFPYRVFMSPEILELEKRCSICGQVISIRHPCCHRTGEIYHGEQCIREVTKAEFLGMAFVDHPVQKYSVPFAVDEKTGQSVDRYNYSIPTYLIDRLASPYDGWSVEWIKQRHPHSLFTHVGRNDPCPCGSEKKYKKCCLRMEGVLMPHCEFVFENPPPPHMLYSVYPDYSQH